MKLKMPNSFYTSVTLLRSPDQTPGVLFLPEKTPEWYLVGQKLMPKVNEFSSAFQGTDEALGKCFCCSGFQKAEAGVPCSWFPLAEPESPLYTLTALFTVVT